MLEINNNQEQTNNNISLISENAKEVTNKPIESLENIKTQLNFLQTHLITGKSFFNETIIKSFEKQIAELNKQYTRLVSGDNLRIYLEPYIMQFRESNEIKDLKVKINLTIENGQVNLEIADTSNAKTQNGNRKQVKLTINYKDGTQKTFNSFSDFYFKSFDVTIDDLKAIYNENDFKTGTNDKDINSRILWKYLTDTTNKEFKHSNLIEKFTETDIKEIFTQTPELQNITSLKYEKLLNDNPEITKEIQFI